MDPLDAYMLTLDEPSGEDVSHTKIVLSSSSDEECNKQNPDVDLQLPNLKKYGKKEQHLEISRQDNTLYPFRKNFYIEPKEIGKMKEDEIQKYRNEHGMRVKSGRGCPRPIMKFSQCGLTHKLYSLLKKYGYESPTPIQQQCIPVIMKGFDIIGVGETGSGKTLAYLLPMFRHIFDQLHTIYVPGTKECRNRQGPISLVLVPTRELSIQIYQETHKFAKHFHDPVIKVICATGGSDMKNQINEIRRGMPTILISTPGRCIDLLMSNSGKLIKLHPFTTFVVIDEADRMFDLGFEPQITKIVNNIREDKQIVLFSATFPRSMENLAKKALHDPVEIVIGHKNRVCLNVDQKIEIVEDNKKFLKLLEILGEEFDTDARNTKILIFVERQDSADMLFKDLLSKGYLSNSIHGGKDQNDRESSLLDFRKGFIPILIATSVASRGIDIKDCNMVINYDCPNHIEDYIHRVGRTGRAGKKEDL